jgi:hypothetical protein
MPDKHLLEAQFWWAFSCLAVAGRRNEEDFQAELVRRNSGFYPDTVEINSIVQEACCHLVSVLNRADIGNVTPRRSLSGWERHILALSKEPGD